RSGPSRQVRSVQAGVSTAANSAPIRSVLQHAQRWRTSHPGRLAPSSRWRAKTVSRCSRPVLASSACVAVACLRSRAPPLVTVLPPRLSSHGHRRQIVTQWHVLRDVLLRDAPFDLVFSLLYPADVAVDDAGMVFLADELVALRMLK